MTEEAKAARREYFRQYRATHRDNLKRNQIRYWERRAAKDLNPETGIELTKQNMN